MTTILFHNPSAGGDDGPDREALLALLRAAGLDPRPHETQGASLREGLAASAERVLVAGGDGTVGQIATRIAHRATPLAVLPLGTANNLARALGAWPSPRHFAEGWRDAARRPLNVVMAEAAGGFGRHRFVEAVGFGAFADAVRHADETGLSGVDAGREAFRRALATAPVTRVRLGTDGTHEEEVETLLVEVMNIALFGPNLVLAPDAEPGDGLLDVATLHPNRRQEMLDWLHAPGSGHPPVQIRRGARVTLGWPGGTVRVDDTPLDFTGAARVAFHIEAEPLTFLVPPTPLAAPQKDPAL